MDNFIKESMDEFNIKFTEVKNFYEISENKEIICYTIVERYDMLKEFYEYIKDIESIGSVFYKNVYYNDLV